MPPKPIRILTSIQSLQAKPFAALFVGLWLALAACNPDTTKVSPGTQDLGKIGTAFLVDTFSLVGYTQSSDSTLTSETNINLVGDYVDPQTGHVKAITYFDFDQPASLSGDTMPHLLRYDSLVITVPYTWQQAPQVQQYNYVELHRLQGPISKETVFLAQDTRPYDTTVLASDTVFAKSVFTRSNYSVKFKLTSRNTTLGQDLLDQGKKGFQIGSSGPAHLAFSQKFFGFALVPKGSNTVVSNFNISGGSFVWYGTLPDSNGAYTTKTYSVSFQLGGQNRFYGSVTKDWAGTPLAGLSSTNRILPSSQAGGQLYAQNFSALWAKLDFPSYIPFKKRNPGLALLKAILELKAVSPPAYAYQGPLSRLLLWQGLADHLALSRNGYFNRAISNGTNSDLSQASSFLQYYDTIATTYSIDLTNYLLAIEQGAVYNSGIILSAPVGVPILYPFVFNIDPKAINHSRLKVYFVKLE